MAPRTGQDHVGLRRAMPVEVRSSEGLGRISTLAVRRMVDAIVDRYLGQEIGVDSLKAANVVAVLLREGSPLVMGVDAAVGAEVVLGHPGIELVELQDLRAPDDLDPAEGHGSDNGALASADRTIAAPWVDDAIREVEFQSDGTAVT